jgi:ribonuclease HI
MNDDSKNSECQFILYFDGCCKGNPGPGGAGSVLYKNDKEIWSDCMFVGEKVTNNMDKVKITR